MPINGRLNQQYPPEEIGRECYLGKPNCSAMINNTLAIERRGGRGGGGIPVVRAAIFAALEKGGVSNFKMAAGGSASALAIGN